MSAPSWCPLATVWPSWPRSLRAEGQRSLQIAAAAAAIAATREQRAAREGERELSLDCVDPDVTRRQRPIIIAPGGPGDMGNVA